MNMKKIVLPVIMASFLSTPAFADCDNGHGLKNSVKDCKVDKSEKSNFNNTKTENDKSLHLDQSTNKKVIKAKTVNGGIQM